MSKKIENPDSMQLFLQKQPYNLTISRHSLGIHQMRVMARIVEKLQPQMSFKVDYSRPNQDLPPAIIEVGVEELVKGENYSVLRAALDGMMKKIVRIYHSVDHGDGTGDIIEIGLPLIQKYEYKHGSSEVKLQIAGELLPQLIDLARGYTRYSLEVAFNTSSPNVLKLYQYIAHFRDKKQIRCDLDMLRQWLQIEDKYKTAREVKAQILNPAMEELRKKADVWFEIAGRVTKGRKMIGWDFNIYTRTAGNAKEKQPALEDPAAKKANEEFVQRLRETYKLSLRQAKKVAAYVSAASSAAQEDKDRLHKDLRDLKVLLLDGKIKNIGAYAAKILNEKHELGL